jgi:hypothetical protein
MKRTIHLTIDADLVEMGKVRRFKDPGFSISELVNTFLRDFFGEEVRNLQKDKLKMEISELEQALALKKAQEVAIMKEREKRLQEEAEEKAKIIWEEEKDEVKKNKSR